MNTFLAIYVVVQLMHYVKSRSNNDAALALLVSLMATLLFVGIAMLVSDEPVAPPASLDVVKQSQPQNKVQPRPKTEKRSKTRKPSRRKRNR